MFFWWSYWRLSKASWLNLKKYCLSQNKIHISLDSISLNLSRKWKGFEKQSFLVFEGVKTLNSDNVQTRISISHAGPGVTGHAGVFTASSSQALVTAREIRVQKGPHCSPPPDNHLSTCSHVTFSVQTSKVLLELELLLSPNAQLLLQQLTSIQ